MNAPYDPLVKGWCPGALRPMLSGDGLVVRVRAYGGGLTQDQARDWRIWPRAMAMA
jgi:precorrin-3B synthase